MNVMLRTVLLLVMSKFESGKLDGCPALKRDSGDFSDFSEASVHEFPSVESGIRDSEVLLFFFS